MEEQLIIIDQSCSYIPVNDVSCGQQKSRFPLVPKVKKKDPGSESGKSPMPLANDIVYNVSILLPLYFFCFKDAFAALIAAFLVFCEIMRPESDQ